MEFTELIIFLWVRMKSLYKLCQTYVQDEHVLRQLSFLNNISEYHYLEN